jgi:hypothetical protein
VFIVFFLPIQYFVLSEIDPAMTQIDAKQELENNFMTIILGSNYALNFWSYSWLLFISNIN